MNQKFIKLMNCMKEALSIVVINNKFLSKDPFVTDDQVKQYRKMLKLNLKEQNDTMKDLTRQANIQAKARQLGE